MESRLYPKAGRPAIDRARFAAIGATRRHPRWWRSGCFSIMQAPQQLDRRMPGHYFEEFTVGQTFRHGITRTITEADNVWFSALTHNPAPLHLDEEYMKGTEFGQRIVNSCLTLSFMVGISVGDTTVGTTVANLGWDEVRFPKPLFHGDTIRIESEVLAVRDSKSRPENGIVVFAHRAYNQHDDLVGECKRTALMMRKPK
jgi:acyl dehydratase